VFLRTDVVIPPSSEVDLPTAVVMRRLPRSSGMDEVEWGTEPGPVVPRVHVSRTLIPGQFGKYPSLCHECSSRGSCLESKDKRC